MTLVGNILKNRMNVTAFSHGLYTNSIPLCPGLGVNTQFLASRTVGQRLGSSSTGKPATVDTRRVAVGAVGSQADATMGMYTIVPGSSYPLGPSLARKEDGADQQGVNFAVASQHARLIQLVLFDVEGN